MTIEQQSVVFELSKPEDYEGIAEIYNEHIQLGQSTMDQSPKKAKDIEGWVEKFHDRERLFVLKKNQRLIGWSIIKRYSDREGYNTTCETAIYLKSTETRKGYGSLMKKEMLKLCKSLGYHHLVAKVLSVNTASIEYNKRLGYEIVGTQKEIGKINGKWIDVVIMQYLFKE